METLVEAGKRRKEHICEQWSWWDERKQRMSKKKVRAGMDSTSGATERQLNPGDALCKV